AEQKQLAVAVFDVAQEEHRAALRHRFHDQHTRHDRRAGEMSLEELLVRGHVLDADDLLSFLELEDAVDEQHRVAMRKNFHDLVDGEHRYFLSFAARLSHASRRAKSRNGIAGLPITFVSDGTSLRTALLAATCTRSPILRCPAKPDWPATTT